MSVVVVRAHPVGSGLVLRVPLPGGGVVELDPDGEEHVIRYDGKTVCVDGDVADDPPVRP